MSLRAFSFSDGISNKYWYVRVSDKTFATVTGKIGAKTPGKLESKNFPSAEVCEKEATKVIAERVRKGYEEQKDEATLALAAAAFDGAANAPAPVALAATPQSVLARPSLGIQDQDIRKFLRVVGKGEIETVKLFLEAGLDPDAPTEWGHAYHEALLNAHLDIVKLLTPQIKGFATEGNTGASHIETATIHNRDGITPGLGDALIQAMIESGYNPVSDPHVVRMLHKLGPTLAVDLIARCSIDLRAPACAGLVVRTIACKNRALADYLLDQSIPLDTRDAESGLAVMHVALEEYGKDLPFIQRLVTAGAKVGALSRGAHHGGKTAVEYAKESMSPEVAAFVGPGDTDDIPKDDLFRAAAHGHLHLIERFLAQGGTVDARDEAGRTMLHYACSADHESTAISVAMFLIKRGLDVNAKDSAGRNALFYYNFSGSGTPWNLGDELNAFLGVDNFFNSTLSKTSSMFWGELTEAAGRQPPKDADERFSQWLSGAEGRSDMLTLILKKAGAEIECIDHEGMTPFLYHARFRPEELLSESIRRGEEDNQRQYALYSILRAKPDVSRRYRDDGATALHHMQNVDIFEKEKLFALMVRFGADFNARDNAGCTPLHYAARCIEEGNFMDLHTEDAIEYLTIHAKADPNIADREGNTPLHYALRNTVNVRHTARPLLKHGANPFAKNHAGISPEDIMVELNVRKDYDEAILEYKAKAQSPRDLVLNWQPIDLPDDAATRDITIKTLGLRSSLALGEYDIDAITTIGTNRILVIGLHDQAHCIDSRTGSILWRMDRIHFPVLHEGVLYCGLGDNTFGAVDPATGQKLWTTGIGQCVCSPIEFYQSKYAIFLAGRSLVAIDLKSKCPHWKRTEESGVSDQVVLWDDKCIFFTEEAEMLYINIESGETELNEGFRCHRGSMTRVGNTIWLLIHGELMRVELGADSVKRVTTGFEFDDDSRWRDYSVNAVLHHRGELYIFVHLEARKQDGDSLYRLCCVDGTRAYTVADFGSDGTVGMTGSSFVHLSSKERKVTVFDLATKQAQEWFFPWLTGDDDIEDCLHINHGNIFVTQKGGNKFQNRDLLYALS